MWRLIKRVVLFTALFFVAIFVYTAVTMTPEDRAKYEAKRKADAIKEAASRPDPPPRPALERVKLEKFDWETGGFGVVAVGSFTIGNGNEYAVKDARIECAFFGGSGTLVSTANQTIYETVDAGKTRRFRKINMGFVNAQAKSAICQLVGISPQNGLLTIQK